MEPNTVWAPADSEPYRMFKEAASRGSAERLAAALRPGINVNALYGNGHEGHTVLHEAASKGQTEIIQYLLAHGATIDILDANQFDDTTPLCYAAQSAQVDAVRLLLDAGADINATGSNDDTVLSAVLPDAVRVEQKHMDTINLLLDRSIDINRRASAYGATVLEQAVKLANHNLIKMLYERGATLEGSLGVAAEFHNNTDTVEFLLSQGVKDTNSYALARAAKQNKMEIARLLLTQHPTVAPAGCHGALHMAALKGHLDMLTLLLDSGFEINSTDDCGQTPLHAACGADRPSPRLIQILLERGADPSARTIRVSRTPYQGGDTPLHASTWRSDVEVVRLLLRAGASVASRNDVGETPLMRFALRMTAQAMRKEGRNLRVEAFQELLEAGSDVNARDHQGRTALHYLAVNNFLDKEENKVKATRLLLEKGIDWSARDGKGMTAADLLQPGNTGLAQLLQLGSSGAEEVS